MAIVLDGTAGITTPEITSAGGPLVVNASAPDNSVVVDASGNVGIGTSSPNERVTIASSGSASYVQICDSSTGTTSGDGLFLGSFNGAAELKTKENAALTFGTNNTERARIDSSGNLLVGTTSLAAYFDGRLNVQGRGHFRHTEGAASPVLFVWNQATSGTRKLVEFGTNSTYAGVGDIATNGSSTSYNTTSDYRLKENIAPMTGALAKVAALKPVTYTWKSTGEADEGFIAHELQEVCPSAVTGEKDAVDAEGNPQYQGIDTSFLAATLTAAIQEQQALIESLTARVVALETQP